jgi:adenylate cyclase
MSARLRRWIKRAVRSLTVWVPLTLALLHSTGVMRIGFVDRVESIIYDTRLRAFMPGTLDDRIVILDIDEKSLAEVGHWPWSRDHLAQLMDRLFDEHQIAVLGVDIVFAEADDRSGLGQLQALAQNELKNEPGFTGRLPELQERLDYDRRFANALRDRPVVLGYYFSSDRDGHRSGTLPAPVLTSETLTELGLRDFSATEWNGYGSNIDKLAQAAPLAGFFNPVVDGDGLVRSLPLLARHEAGYYESLSLAMFRALAGLPDVFPGFPPDAYTAEGYPHLESVLLEQGGRATAVPVDNRTAVLVPFRGPGGVHGGSFPYLPVADVLKGRVPEGALQDKIVLLGTTAPGLLDLRATPVGETYPGVEIHANVLAGLLDGTLPSRPDYAAGYDLLVMVVVGLILALTLPWMSALPALLVSLTLASGLVGLNLWMYASMALVMPLAAALMMVGMAYALNTSYGYFVESRSKRELANLFGSYVPPELVDEMLKEPDRYSMQATDRELTVMFSDMRGFTNLSEKMQPAQLQHFLNRLFTKLSLIIRQQRGTIDKFMGDCVMAFWGAPIPEQQHARLAVQAALAMRQAVHDINAENTTQGLPAIGMGVGLNTGTMCVGDMGSDLRRSYTVIGDAVNLGSRLEGMGKHYGVDIVVSAATREQAGEGFVWQELDRVKVKGKEEAVTIFTAVGMADQVTPAQLAELQQWHDCLHACRAQDWPKALQTLQPLRQSHPDHALYALYTERIADWQASPPPPDWDGSTKFESK